MMVWTWSLVFQFRAVCQQSAQDERPDHIQLPRALRLWHHAGWEPQTLDLGGQHIAKVMHPVHSEPFTQKRWNSAVKLSLVTRCAPGPASTPTQRWMLPLKDRWSETSWTWPGSGSPREKMCRAQEVLVPPAPPAGRDVLLHLKKEGFWLIWVDYKDSTRDSWPLFPFSVFVCVCSLCGGRERTKSDLSADEKVKRAFYLTQRYADQVKDSTSEGLAPHSILRFYQRCIRQLSLCMSRTSSPPCWMSWPQRTCVSWQRVKTSWTVWDSLSAFSHPRRRHATFASLSAPDIWTSCWTSGSRSTGTTGLKVQVTALSSP